MRGSMVDIQYVTAKNRREKRKKERNKQRNKETKKEGETTAAEYVWAAVINA